MDQTRHKLWTKHFILLSAIVLIVGVSSSMLNTSLPLYVKHLGGGNAQMGLATTLFSLSALLFRPVSGLMLDKKGRRIVMMAGLAVFSLFLLLFHWAFSVGILLLLRFLSGFGFSAYSTASGTVAADLVPKDRMIEGLGYFGVFQTVAMAIGPSLGLSFAGKSNYSGLFILALVLSAAGLAVVFFLTYERENGRSAQSVPEMKKGNPRAAAFELSAIPSAVTLFFIALTMGAVMSFLPVYAQTRGIESIGIYFTVNAPAVLVTRIFSGKLVDRFGISPVIVTGMGLSAASMVLLASAHTLGAFLVVSVLNGLGMGILFPILNTLAVSYCAPNRRGAATATYYASFDIGIGSGALLGGLFSAAFGYPALYLLSTGCFAISYLIYLFWVSRMRARNASEEAGVAEEQTAVGG